MKKLHLTPLICNINPEIGLSKAHHWPITSLQAFPLSCWEQARIEVYKFGVKLAKKPIIAEYMHKNINEWKVEVGANFKVLK